jgi:hypothetical protein
MNKEMEISTEISAFLKFLERVEKDYAWALQEESKADAESQDRLHQLELLDFSYHDQARIARQLKECRIRRRSMKDTILVCTPIVEFIESEKGKMLISQLQQVLGRVRKEERRLEERTYTPKVLSSEDFHTPH